MALTQVDQGLLGSNAQYTGFKNRIINGAMVIDQRNAGAAVTAGYGFSVDRWQVDSALGTGGKINQQQNAGSVTPPVGFKNYLGMTSTSAYSVLTGDAFALIQRIEGLNVYDLAWGTANAATITVSFWVRSSLTGTFGGSVLNSAGNRSYPFTYTISSANTWEQKSVTIAGDTSGTWLTTNGTGMTLSFGLGSGSTYSGTAGAWASAYYYTATGATSVVGTNGATFYITGVQFEKGSTATSFDYRPYGTELQLCQRYYEKSFPQDVAPVNSYGNGFGGGSNGWVSFSTTNIRGPQFGFRVSKRTAPTMSFYNGNSPTSGTLGIYDSGGSTWRATTVGTSYSTTEEWRTDSTTSGWTPTTGNSYLFSGWWTASAEL